MSLETGNDPLTIDKDDGKCHPVSLALNIFHRSESLHTSGGEFAFYGDRISSISREQTEKQNLEIFPFYFPVASSWRSRRQDVQSSAVGCSFSWSEQACAFTVARS